MRYEDMEFLNFKNVLSAIDELHGSSRATIAKKLSLSRTTVSNITSSLISKGVVCEVQEMEQRSASRGRPGAPLALRDDVWYALGASYYSDSWNFVLCSLSGKMVNEHVVVLPDLTPELLVSTLLDGIEYMMGRVKGKLLPAIGLGLPGIVDSENGDVLWAYDLKWVDRVVVRKAVEKRFDLQAYCLNRYTLAGLAEYTYANPENDKNMVYVGLGSGIRSAIFVNGKLLEGASFSAGRIGHVPIDPSGPLCECGKHGCLLTLANEKALLNKALELSVKPEFADSPLAESKEITVEQICRLADQHDKCACKCIDAIAGPITIALGMIIDIINPRRIVIGGPIGYSSRYLVDKLNKDACSVAEESPYRVMTITQGKLKDIGSALGAATLVLSHKPELLYLLDSNAID